MWPRGIRLLLAHFRVSPSPGKIKERQEVGRKAKDPSTFPESFGSSLIDENQKMNCRFQPTGPTLTVSPMCALGGERRAHAQRDSGLT